MFEPQPGGAAPADDGPPRRFNAAGYFIDRHPGEGRADKVAYIDAAGSYTYRDLARRVNRVGNALRGLGLSREARVALALHDGIDFPAVFWGCLKAGVVPVPLNTLLTSELYRYILADCGAQALVVSGDLYARFGPVLDRLPGLERVIVAGREGQGHTLLAELTDAASPELEAAPACGDDIAFWLYSSGSTGHPKGVMHRHASLYWTARLYGRKVLGIGEDDVIFSAAKLFFAYGLGNGMSFPLAVGATTVLLEDRPTPEAVMGVLQRHQPTLFCGVPTLYAAILVDPANDRARGSRRLRRCISAGEALSAEVGRRWEARFGAAILDGVGTTEMLHIFLSNRPDQVCYGTSGVLVPGYRARLVDDHNRDVADGDLGELLISGPSMAAGYWNQPDKTQATFVGDWMHTGDKYVRDASGRYHYHGRVDDMFKSGGNWVSPFEVESALAAHDKVLEAAVIPHRDAGGNDKPKAYVVLKPHVSPSAALATELQAFVKQRLEPWKYPRWIHFADSLPKTATGKIQRFRLRELDRSGS